MNHPATTPPLSPGTSAAPLPPTLRPDMTASLMAETGLDGAMLETLVYRFYDRVRDDALLGPVFDERVADWAPHLKKMVSFWHSVALMTGTYKGTPMVAHVSLPVEWRHFERWLELFRQTATEVCPPRGAEHLIERAERIARSLNMAIEVHQSADGAPAVAPRA